MTLNLKQNEDERTILVKNCPREKEGGISNVDIKTPSIFQDVNQFSIE